MKNPGLLRRTLALMSLSAMSFFAATNVPAESDDSRKTTAVILVHGAWADGSSWSKVIPLLEEAATSK